MLLREAGESYKLFILIIQYIPVYIIYNIYIYI
jgi:hypothetical protein